MRLPPPRVTAHASLTVHLTATLLEFPKMEATGLCTRMRFTSRMSQARAPKSWRTREERQYLLMGQVTSTNAPAMMTTYHLPMNRVFALSDRSVKTR